jgi:hypothetical protein
MAFNFVALGEKPQQQQVQLIVVMALKAHTMRKKMTRSQVFCHHGLHFCSSEKRTMMMS